MKLKVAGQKKHLHYQRRSAGVILCLCERERVDQRREREREREQQRRGRGRDPRRIWRHETGSTRNAESACNKEACGTRENGLRHARKCTATKTQGRGGGAEGHNKKEANHETTQIKIGKWQAATQHRGQRRNSTPGWATCCSAACDTSATPTSGTIEGVENSVAGEAEDGAAHPLYDTHTLFSDSVLLRPSWHRAGTVSRACNSVQWPGSAVPPRGRASSWPCLSICKQVIASALANAFCKQKTI